MIEIHLQVEDRQRGFTLAEMTISLFVTVVVLLGVLTLFDFSNKLSRVQTNVTDLQQSLRVGQSDMMRMIRMAGRGGLPLGALPTGWAVSVRNNVAEESYIGADDTTPEIVPGSDVLTVRGVFAGSIYQVNSNEIGAFELEMSAGAPIGGKIRISSATPTSIPQDLSSLREAIEKRRPEALLLISPRSSDIWAVVELDYTTSDITNPDLIEVKFKITGGEHTTEYLNFSPSGPGVYPPDLTNAAFVGILEEHRFYVRREFAVAGDRNSDLAPRLSRARVYPGTETPYEDGSWRQDIADNVFDLQIALALDTPAGGCAMSDDDVNCTLAEAADGENDDWMYNGEEVTDPAAFANAELLYVRLNTLARTDRRDRDYQAPVLERVEDNRYDGAAAAFNLDTERMYRRRLLRTIVDMRNLG